MNDLDQKFMRKALEIARKGIISGQTPFGACIVKGERIVASAHNTVWKSTDITCHAEINAIRQACRKLKTIDLSGCIIYSTCEPCPMCFSACHWAKISRIIYGTRIRDARRIGFNELSVSNVRLKRLGRSRVRVAGGLLKNDAMELFRTWKSQPGRRVY